MEFVKKHKLLILISLVLFLIPFIWLKPGEIDMGGDGGRLYMYDAANFIKQYALYNILPLGSGAIEEQYYFLPFVSVVALLKYILGSLYLLSVLQNSIKLILGFFSMYAIVKELIQKSSGEKSWRLEIVSILSGLFYIFSPILTDQDRYVNPLQVHDQVFLNPLIFYLTLKFIFTKQWRYIVGIVGLSTIFAHNFSYTAAPAIFSFYPLAFAFLLLYGIVIYKQTLLKKGIILGIFFFILLHFFHLGPELAGFLTPGSGTNMRVFNSEIIKIQVGYYYGVLGFASLAKNILLPPITNGIWQLLAFISPLIIILGFMRGRKHPLSLVFLLTTLFFLPALYFMSAKVSFSGVKLYEMLFLYMPGFTMFRNFYIQWMFVFTFFYALLFGQALFLLCSLLSRKKEKLMLAIVAIYVIGSAWVFIKGDQFNVTHVESDNVGRHVTIDPQYEKLLAFVRNIPYGGGILQFPFSDFNFQVVHGTNDGAYIGTTSIGQLTGVKDFSGYWHTAPYSEAFLAAGKERDYETLKKILGLLNIRYIFYNSDPLIYDTTFFGRPFSYVKESLPKTQKDYGEFIKPLVDEKLFESGPYRLYLTKEDSFIPVFYIPKETVVYEYNPKYDRHYNAASSFIVEASTSAQPKEKRTGYIEKNDCISSPVLQPLCEKDIGFNTIPQIFFKQINPTKYTVTVSNIKEPFVLVFSNTFHDKWKLFLTPNTSPKEPVLEKYFAGEITEGKSENIFFNETTFETLGLQSISDNNHFSVNSFANAWYITPKELGMRSEATFIVEMTDQRLFYIGLVISLVGAVGFVLWIAILFLKKKF